MAYTDTIERLAKIVDQLAPIGQMSKGEPLRSDDWNGLVGAVNALAQLAIVREKGGEASQEGQFAAAEHDHLSQVDLSWFDPATRTLIEQRGIAPETAAELKRIDSGMVELRKIVTTMQAQLKSLQLRMDAIDDKGRDGDGRLGRLELRVEATHDLRPELAKVDGRFTALNEKLAQAIKVKDQLVDHNGNAIDLPDVVKRLGDVEDLRENLKGPDGQLARYRDFDARVVELERGALTQENVDGIISERIKSAGILENLSDGILDIVKANNNSWFEEMGGKLAGFETGLTDVSLQVGKTTDTLDKLSGRVSLTETQLGRVGTLETKVGDLGVRTNGLETTTQQHGTTLAGLKDLPVEIAKLDTRLRLVEPFGQHIFAIEEKTNLFDSKLLAFESYDSRIKNVEGLSELVSVTNERVAVLEGGLSIISADFSKISLSTSTLDTRLSSLEGLSVQVASVDQRVGTVELQLKGTEADIGKIATSVKGFDTRISDVEKLSDQMVAIDKRIITVERELKITTLDIGKITASNDLFDTRITAVEGASSQFGTTNQRVGALESQVKVATADTGKLQASIGNLGTRVSAVEGMSTQFASTNQRVGALESQFSVATADLGKLQTSVNGVSTRLKTVEGATDQFAVTTQRVGTLETKLTATTTDFTRLESRLKKIEVTRPIIMTPTPTSIPR